VRYVYIYIYIHAAANILNADRFQIYWDQYLVTGRAAVDCIAVLYILVFDKPDRAAQLTDLWGQINYNILSEYSTADKSLWRFNIRYTSQCLVHILYIGHIVRYIYKCYSYINKDWNTVNMIHKNSNNKQVTSQKRSYHSSISLCRYWIF
jgi:hypothetical protein